MSFSPALRKAAYALPIAFALASGAANAGGLTPKACYSKDEAAQVLKQEGQEALIMGNRETYGKERFANVFYVNNQGYGYNVEGNAPLGEKSTKLCVGATYKDVHLNSLNNPEIPEWAKGIKSTGNGIDLENAYKHGIRVIFGARTYTQKPDGTEIPGKYIVVVASVKDTDANVWSVDSLGRPDTSFDMEKAGITQKMADMLNAKQASISDGSTKTLALVAK